MDADRPQTGGSSGSLSVVRASAVLVAFVVAVAVLVAVGTRPSVSSTPSATPTTVTTPGTAGSTTSTPGSSTTTTTRSGHHTSGSGTTTSTVSPSAVSVVVANATSTNGLAAHYTTVIGGAGYQMKTPVDAGTTEATSAVYYTSGMQQPAQAIASSIGVKPAQVQPLTTSVPVSGVTGVDVVVVIGQDLASGSTPTTAGS